MPRKRFGRNRKNRCRFCTPEGCPRPAYVDYKDVSLLKKLCTNMKAPDKDVIIYVVAVGVSGDNRDMLKACASAPDFYFDATDGAQLTGAFATIANQISALHLSK